MKIKFSTTFPWGYQHACMCVNTMCVCETTQDMLPNISITILLNNSCTCLGAIVGLRLLQQHNVYWVVAVHQSHLLFEFAILCHIVIKQWSGNVNTLFPKQCHNMFVCCYMWPINYQLIICQTVNSNSWPEFERCCCVLVVLC